MSQSSQKPSLLSSFFRTLVSLCLGTAFTMLVVLVLPEQRNRDLNASEQTDKSSVSVDPETTSNRILQVAFNQNNKNSSRAKTPPSTTRLPDHFRKIGLTDEQIQEVRKVQQKHQAEIDKYESLLEQKKKQRDEEILEVLTRDQKRKLKTLKKKGALKRKKK